MPRRITLFFIFSFLLFTALVLRTVYLQVLPNERLAHMNQKQFQTILNVEGRRGFIYDKEGRELAASVLAYSLYADPKLIKNPKTVARKLSKVLPVSYSKLVKKFSNKKRRFYWVYRRMEPSQKDMIKKWKIRGLGFIEEPKRVYPNENLLSSVLGFVGSSGQGLGGLENRFESYLNGSGTSVKVQRDARGRPLFVNGVLFTENPDGLNLHLSIDREMQHTLEKELSLAMEKHEAAAAWGVVLDAETSKVLAMANLPDFNPNKPFGYTSSERRNRSITDPFEPGSTLKTMTVAAALREQIAMPQTKYFCENGTYKIGRRTIREADTKHKFGWLSVEDILARSSNIGTSKIAFELGDAELRRALLDFGFGAKASTDFPGESRGILPGLPWNRHLLSNISFGHGIAVTPLQVATAYASIANGGIFNKAMLVSKVTDSNGRLVEDFEKKTQRRVLSPEISESLLAILEKVVQKGGTGPKAQVPGYRVGGKTGTAQKVNPASGHYEKGAYVSSFVGIVPIDRPRFVIMVALDEPKKSYYASEVAAPIFANVASFALRHSGIEPTDFVRSKLARNQRDKKLKEAKNYQSKQAKAIAKVRGMDSSAAWKIIPKMEGLSLREVMQRMRHQGLEAEVYGRGKLSRTYPLKGEPLPNNGKLKLYFK